MSFMPMERDVHEKLLSELLTADLEHSRRTEILQELRADYSNVLGDFENLNKSSEKLQKDNDDLVRANSMLFRQAGIYDKEDKKEEQQQKDFSETITLEQIERGVE
jgi:hypothetical protein